MLRELGEHISEQEISGVMHGLDMNSDGVLNYKEFASSVTKEMREGGFNLV